MYRTSERTSLSRKMAELEDRWRKSQEDRYILELKFKEVLKGLADKNEGAKLLKIRDKYYRFLENEDRRNERNDQILRALDKIESQANMLAAKTERLRLLKLHYEAYMKRMYPAWKGEIHEEEGLSSKNKERGYSSYKHEKGNVPYTSSRGEENVISNLPRQTPRYSEKTYYSPNDIFHEVKTGTHTLSNLDSGNVMPSKSKSERNRFPALNLGLSNVYLNSDDKSGNSHRLSIEQEENTSKDLLNVSLSDDNPVNDSTIPVEMGKNKVQTQNGNEQSIVGKTQIKEVPEKSRKFRVNPNDDYLTDKSDCSNIYLDRQLKERISNDSVGFRGNQNDAADLDEHNGRSILGNFSEKERDLSDTSVKAELNEKREVCGYSPEFKPSVVVTQPTPDIGKSSSEDDISRKRIPADDNKIKSHSYLPSHEPSGVNSEAEVSDGEQVGSRNSDDFGKYSPDEALSPRSTTAIDNAGGNVDDPFQFSSSDAELENQMAAMVERKRNDKSIPKVLGGSSFQKPREDEHQTHDALEVDDQQIQQPDVSYSVEEEISHPSKIRDDISNASTEDQNVVRNEFENKLIEPVDWEIDGQEVESKENRLVANKKMANRRDMKSDDSEKDIEAGGSSVDVNSEILDEDQNISGDVAAHHTEESRYEAQYGSNSNLADVENIVADAEWNEEYNEQEENAHQPDKVADEYDHRRNYQGEELGEETETVDEVENEQRKYFEREDGNKYDKTSVSNHQVEKNEENLEEFGLGREKENVKYVEDEQEVTDEINEQRDEGQGNSNVERNPVTEESELVRPGMREVREDEENFEQVQEEGIDRRNHEIRHVVEKKESDVFNQEHEQSEDIEKEEWKNETYKQEGIVESREEEGNDTSREVVEEEFEKENSYERQGVMEEQDDDERYERHAAEEQEERQYEKHDATEEQEEERQYERHGSIEEQVEEKEYERHDMIEEQEEDRQYERYDSTKEQEEKEYERRDAIEEPEEERQYERPESIEEQVEEREYERNDNREEQEGEREHERYDNTKEQVEEKEYERHDTREEPEEEREYERHDTEEEREYEMHDTREEPEEEREYGRDDTIEESEYENYAEEQGKGRNERYDAIAEENKNQATEEQYNDRYERSGGLEEGEEEGEYERHKVKEEVEYETERNDVREEFEKMEDARVAEGDSDHGVEEEREDVEESRYIKGSENMGRDDELTEESHEEGDNTEQKIIMEEVENAGQHKEWIEDVDKNVSEELVHSNQHQTQDDLKSEDIAEEIQVAQQEKDAAGGEAKAISVKKEAANAEVKDVKKQSVVASNPVEKPERNVKESSNVSGRPLTRQFGKKEYDPHKVEKLKSTIRKFQLKKDSKSDKTGRKQAESKK